tara:strand:+ start:954 stop:1112 length:159 start_codon:yes stop_codon:yes gene_type:complete
MKNNTSNISLLNLSPLNIEYLLPLIMGSKWVFLVFGDLKKVVKIGSKKRGLK